MRYIAYKWFWSVLDLLYPPECGGCKKPGTLWCQDCQNKTHRILPPLCSICGQEILYGDICNRCIENPPKMTAIRSWAIFTGPIREAIHQLKYHRNVGLGIVFSKNLATILKTVEWEINLITPVPLGVARLKERGYNQAALLARPLAYQVESFYNPRILWRIRETKSQVDLNYAERKINVSGAFKAEENLVRNKNILVVDDVATSGSTLESCADALLIAQANKIYGLTLTRAGGQLDHT